MYSYNVIDLVGFQLKIFINYYYCFNNLHLRAVLYPESHKLNEKLMS